MKKLPPAETPSHYEHKLLYRYFCTIRSGPSAYRFDLLPLPPDTIRVEFNLDVYEVERWTPTGWIIGGGKFVKAGWSKKFACPTREEAFEALIARSRRRLELLKNELRTAKLIEAGLAKIKPEAVISPPAQEVTDPRQIVSTYPPSVEVPDILA